MDQSTGGEVQNKENIVNGTQAEKDKSMEFEIVNENYKTPGMTEPTHKDDDKDDKDKKKKKKNKKNRRRDESDDEDPGPTKKKTCAKNAMTPKRTHLLLLSEISHLVLPELNCSLILLPS